ncbi:hypothetical protein HPB50_018333 [Hyalomma asiaticum]|uniref:Uncharacterized protein n=1 Tax=Hyalomma asiaticum TaxID=266040 RepID=A0ACB7RP85_HYAAI|nr:hypothetical protein HPB50_018333 [Hyalomma asiaticum]
MASCKESAAPSVEVSGNSARPLHLARRRRLSQNQSNASSAAPKEVGNRRAVLQARLPPSVSQKTLFADDKCSPRPQGVSIGERSTCPFVATVDLDGTRIPAELPMVKCNCPGTLCSSEGDYRCQEVRNTFSVTYRDGAGDSKLVNGTVELTTSCVCAVSRTAISGPGGLRTANVNNELS